jgi:hypothetical protein
VYSSDLVEATVRGGLPFAGALASRPLERRFVAEDWELRVFGYVVGKRIGLSQRELVGKVVETGPQVVDRVADDRGPDDLLALFEPDAKQLAVDLRIGIGVGLDSESVSVALRSAANQRVQLLYVAERPVELDMASV